MNGLIMRARVKVALLLAALCCLGLYFAPIAAADHTVGGGTSVGSTGNEDDGRYWDLSAPGTGDVNVQWERTQVNCNWGADHIPTQAQYGCGAWQYARVTVGSLPDYQGHHTCIQASLDWDTPDGSGGDHYDMRMVRVCKPNSTHYISGAGGYTEPNPECNKFAIDIPCDSPLGRVQIARWVPDFGNFLDTSKECWYRLDSRTYNDCLAWDPSCPVGGWACRGWILQRDGSTQIRDGGRPTYPSFKH